jgi:hypothetical protein
MSLERKYACGVAGDGAINIYTFVTTEGIDCPRARLKSSLAHEERCEANKRL